MKKIFIFILLSAFVIFIAYSKTEKGIGSINADKKIEDKLFIVWHSPKDEESAVLVQKYLNKYFIDALKKFDIVPKYKLIFTIHPTKSSFEQASHEKSYNIYAAYSDGEIHFLYKDGLTEAMIEEIVLHELIHFLVDIKSNSNAPDFLAEGLCYYYEYLYLDKFMDDDSFKLLSREELFYNFSGYNSFNFDDIVYSSHYFIKNFIMNHGQDKMNLILAELENDKDFLTVYKKILGEDFLIK